MLFTPSLCHKKYVTLFLSNFDPLPLSHFVTHPGTPKVRYNLEPTSFVGLVQKTRTKAPCANSLSIVRGAFVRGSFVWKVLSGDLLSVGPTPFGAVHKVRHARGGGGPRRCDSL